MSIWIQALKKFNNEREGKYMIPRKGTPEHTEVKALMSKMKNEKNIVPTISAKQKGEEKKKTKKKKEIFVKVEKVKKKRKPRKKKEKLSKIEIPIEEPEKILEESFRPQPVGVVVS